MKTYIITGENSGLGFETARSRLRGWRGKKPGAGQLLDQPGELVTYYLLEKGSRQDFVKVAKDCMTTTELIKRVESSKFVIGKYRFGRS